MLRFKQIVVKPSGNFAALASDGTIYAQVRVPPHHGLQWRPVDTEGLILPIVHLATHGDRLVAVDRNGAIYEQGSDGRLGAELTWHPVEMTEAA